MNAIIQTNRMSECKLTKIQMNGWMDRRMNVQIFLFHPQFTYMISSYIYSHLTYYELLFKLRCKFRDSVQIFETLGSA